MGQLLGILSILSFQLARVSKREYGVSCNVVCPKNPPMLFPFSFREQFVIRSALCLHYLIYPSLIYTSIKWHFNTLQHNILQHNLKGVSLSWPAFQALSQASNPSLLSTRCSLASPCQSAESAWSEGSSLSVVNSVGRAEHMTSLGRSATIPPWWRLHRSPGTWIVQRRRWQTLTVLWP